MAGCACDCIYHRRKEIDQVEINTSRSRIPDGCPVDDALQKATEQKVKTRFGGEETGTCPDPKHCDCTQKEGAVETKTSVSIHPFETDVQVNECKYHIVGTYRLTTWDIAGTCVENGGSFKLTMAHIEGTDAVVTIENIDVSDRQLDRIREVLRKG